MLTSAALQTITILVIITIAETCYYVDINYQGSD